MQEIIRKIAASHLQYLPLDLNSTKVIQQNSITKPKRTLEVEK